MTRRIKTLIVSSLVLLLTLPVFASEKEELPGTFRLKGKLHQVEERRTGAGSDILWTGPDSIAQNLSRDFPGENIFPGAQVAGGDFYITWIHWRKGDVRLYLYDSLSQVSREIVSGCFHFISGESRILFDEYHSPRFLVFKANRSDNDDLFLYNFETGEIDNLTSTAKSEKEFSISMEAGAWMIETRTLGHIYRYRFNPDSGSFEMTWKEIIEKRPPDIYPQLDPVALNTYICFGDSITWGKMRMNDLPMDPTNSYHHPELAYPKKIQETLEPTYGTLPYFVLAVPGDTTYNAVLRVDSELATHSAKYFLFMLGTNDAISGKYSNDSSLENLEYIIDAALGKDMFVVISTIPPRNDKFNIPRVVANIDALNTGILALANEKGIKYIDTFTAYMNYNPPDGWKDMLEDRGANDVYIPGMGGQHPSPLGHDVMTDLFTEQLLSFPPATPTGLVVRKPGSNYIRLRWSRNQEFDFSHYRVEFGYFPDNLNHSVDTTATYYNFIHPPFLFAYRTKVYFRLLAVDTSGTASVATATESAEFE